MGDGKNRVCPVERAGGLDSRIRRWVQDPRKMLSPYVKEGMVVVDVGCGPGFFVVDMAELVGESGRVIACDLQEGMLAKLRDKIAGTEIEGRVTLHKCEEDKIGIGEKVDFVLMFYVVHEVPDKEALFGETAAMLKPGGQVLIVEPPLHVRKKAFEVTVGQACAAGLAVIERPKVFLSKAVLLKKV